MDVVVPDRLVGRDPPPLCASTMLRIAWLERGLPELREIVLPINAASKSQRPKRWRMELHEGRSGFRFCWSVRVPVTEARMTDVWLTTAWAAAILEAEVTWPGFGAAEVDRLIAIN